MQIPLSRPSIKRSDMDSVLSCMVTDNLGPGELSAHLVKLVKDYIGVEGGIAVREYQRAIRIVFEAGGLKEGDHIVLTPLHPVAYAQVAYEMGIEPVYIDVEADNGCISCKDFQKKVPSDVKMVGVYGTLGFVPDMETLLESRIPLIEDLSQAIGANTGTRRLGTYGSYTLMSMEPEGIFTSGGGVVILGRGRKEVNTLQKIVEPYQPDILLPDFNAALGLTQVQSIEKYLARRKEIAQIFSQAILQSRHRTLSQPGDGENVYYSFPVLITSGLKDVQAYCRKQGIETSPAFAHTILGKNLIPEGEWPVARSLHLRCLRFPLYPSLSRIAIERVQKVLTTLP